MKKYFLIFLGLLLTLSLLAGCCGTEDSEPTPDVAPSKAAAISEVGRELIGGETQWSYLCGQEPSPSEEDAWTQPEFDDSAWEKGEGGFGAKNGEIAALGGYTPKTLLPMTQYGEAVPVYFFRASFNVEDPSALPAVEGGIVYDDAVIVYINGVSVFEGNLPEGGFKDNTAFGSAGAQDAPLTGSFRVAAHMLKAGKNTVAVELHQAAKTSSDIYFELSSLVVTENSGTLIPDGLCLFALGDGAVAARWQGAGDMTLRYAPAGEGPYPETAKSNKPTLTDENGETHYSAELNGITAGAGYTYWIESGTGRSEQKSFTMPGEDGFSFLLLGDPQIIGEDSALALERAASIFPDCSFALIAGDLVDSSVKIEQYKQFLNTPAFSSLPIAAVIGNHEDAKLYDTYFAPESLPFSGRDFRFSYGGALFVCLDSNAAAASHEKFLRESVESGDWDWVIVCMHHSLFSAGKHAEDDEITAMRGEYVRMFTENDVDLVLSGHDHIYARTGVMEGQSPVKGTQKTSAQTMYLCAGSSTGSKYYDRQETDITGFALIAKEDRPTATRIEVKKDGLHIVSCYADDGSVFDDITFTRSGKRVNSAKLPVNEALMKSESEYLLSTQLSNGAFAMYPAKEGENKVNPYFADYTAMALIKTGETQAVRDYIEWHFAHLNTSGYDVNGIPYTIYDYTAVVKDGQVKSEHASMSYDSTDSYAASFLMLLQEYFEATGDADYISQRCASVGGVAQVLLSTVKDGLTVARPDYTIQYLMDNCEVHLALGAVTELLKNAVLPGLSGVEAQNYTALAENLSALESEMSTSLERRLWNESAGRYEFALTSSGKAAEFDGSVFYPESISQLSPIIYAELSPKSSRAQAIYAKFCKDWSWQAFEHVDSGATEFYWGMAAYCAAVMGDKDRLDSYLIEYKKRAADHAYPLFNSDAAWVVLACHYMN